MSLASVQNFSITIGSSEEAVRDGLTALRRHLGLVSVGEETAASVELGVAEALNNVVEHAYGAGKSGPIVIEARADDMAIDVTLTDEGTPLPQHKLPPAHLPETDVALDDMPEGGFGWFLIRQLAFAVRYTRFDKYNRLELQFMNPIDG